MANLAIAVLVLEKPVRAAQTGLRQVPVRSELTFVAVSVGITPAALVRALYGFAGVGKFES